VTQVGIAEVVNTVRTTATALVGFDWRPFDRAASLRFRTHDGGHLGLRIDGVHLLAARQALLGRWDYISVGEEHWEDWGVHYFDILIGGEFLERFLGQQLGLPSHVFVYSLSGAAVGSAGFVRPIHLALVTGGGDLDLVCEVV
jgi:hypothetical protein